MKGAENLIYEMTKDIKIPKMVKVKQKFNGFRINRADIPVIIEALLLKNTLADKIKPGMSICITAGSRGIANVDIILKSIVDFCIQKGAKPFVIPAMGSHGGATVEGQVEILRSLGITEEFLGCPIKATMETRFSGYTQWGGKVYIDRYAAEADGIIVFNRIKAHTAFRGPYESGIMKMLTIGLGKQYGAEVCHSSGIKHIADNIRDFGKTVIKNAPVLFAVACIENPFDETYKLVALDAGEIEEEEPRLLKEALRVMPKIYFQECDVLIVDEIGKNISGDGMDPNITGTFATPYASGGLKAQRRGILSLTPQTHGNANGIGMADVISKRVFDALDLKNTYPNAITSTLLNLVRIPVIAQTDEELIKLCIKTCVDIKRENVRIIRIKNTLELGTIQISESMLKDAERLGDSIEIISIPEALEFNSERNLW